MRLLESNRLLILLYPLQEKTITTSGYTIVTINRNTIVTVNRITIVKSICWLTRRFRHCHQAALDIWTYFVSHVPHFDLAFPLVDFTRYEHRLMLSIMTTALHRLFADASNMCKP